MRKYTQIWLTFALLIALLPLGIKEAIWDRMSDTERERVSVGFKADLCGMDEEEFKLMSAVVEAESDRNPDHTEGKKLIALTIFNRQASEDFPDTITGVISQSGQFTVYYDGIYKQTGRTKQSDDAVVDAYFWEQKDHPNVIYFNCIGFNGLGQAYEYVEGNYFETLGE